MKLGPAKLRILLSNIKQTTSQNTHILYESLAGNQQNLLSKLHFYVELAHGESFGLLLCFKLHNMKTFA